jgi:hypothetical protein
MNTVVTRLNLVCISLIAISLLYTNLSFAALDPATAVGIWRFDEGQGGLAIDASGHGNHGNIMGAQWVEGKSGTALKFTGEQDNSRVEVPDSDSLALSDAFTVMAWVNLDEFVTNAAIVTKGTTPYWGLDTLGPEHTPNGWKIRLNSPRDNNVTGQNFPNNETGRWYHLAMVVNGRGTECLKLYVDGKLQPPLNCTPCVLCVGDIVSPEPLYIGYEQRNSKYTLGTIDEVIILNVALDKNTAEADLQNIITNGTTVSVSPTGKIALTWGRIKANY